MPKMPFGGGEGPRPPEGEYSPRAKETFEEELRGNFHRMPNGNWSSRLGGVDSVITTNPALPDDGAPKSLNFTVRYDVNGRKKSVVFTLMEDGRLLGRLPKELEERGLDKGRIYEELLRIVRDFRPKHQIMIEADIFPSGDPLQEPSGVPGPGADRGPENRASTDSERLAAMNRHEGYVATFVSKSGGYNSYYGMVFKGCLLVDSPIVGNAAYVIPLEARINAESVPLDEKDQKKWLESQPWLEWLLKTKKEVLKEHGALRFPHQGEWEKKIMAAIEKFDQDEEK